MVGVVNEHMTLKKVRTAYAFFCKEFLSVHCFYYNLFWHSKIFQGFFGGFLSVFLKLFYDCMF